MKQAPLLDPFPLCSKNHISVMGSIWKHMVKSSQPKRKTVLEISLKRNIHGIPGVKVETIVTARSHLVS